jgi:hypothetical protein
VKQRTMWTLVLQSENGQGLRPQPSNLSECSSAYCCGFHIPPAERNARINLNRDSPQVVIYSSDMSELTRRDFTRGDGLATALSCSRILGANDRVAWAPNANV